MVLERFIDLLREVWGPVALSIVVSAVIFYFSTHYRSKRVAILCMVPISLSLYTIAVEAVNLGTPLAQTLLVSVCAFVSILVIGNFYYEWVIEDDCGRRK